MNDEQPKENFDYKDIGLEDIEPLDIPPSTIKIITLDQKDVYGDEIWFGNVLLGWINTNIVEAEIAISRNAVAGKFKQPVRDVRDHSIYYPLIEGLKFLSIQETKTIWRPIIDEMEMTIGYKVPRRKSWGKNDTQKVTKKYYEKLLLKPELVPVPLWGKSLFNALKRDKRWRALRQKVLEEASGKCQICQSHYEKGMICHERWDYNEANFTATLTGFELVCPDCNFVLHYGRSAQIIMSMTDPQKSIELFVRRDVHMQRINRLSRAQCQSILFYATKEHSRRSKKKWKVKISPLIRKQFPELKGVRIR